MNKLTYGCGLGISLLVVTTVRAETYLYRGEIQFLHQSGAGCQGASTQTRTTDFYVRDDGQPDRYEGYLTDEKISQVRRVSGNRLDDLQITNQLSPTHANRLKQSIQSIGADSMTGEQHGAPLPDQDPACGTDSATLKLTRIQKLDVDKLFRLAKAKFDRDYGQMLFNSDLYDIAEAPLRRTVAYVEQEMSVDSAALVDTLILLGLATQSQGRYADAEATYRRAARIAEASKPEQVPLCLLRIASLLRVVGRFDEAEILAQRARELNAKELTDNSPQSVVSVAALSNAVLGDVMDARHRHSDAEPYRRAALAFRERAVGAEGRQVGDALNRLGRTLNSEQKYTEAEGVLRHSMEIYEKKLGVNGRCLEIALGEPGHCTFKERSLHGCGSRFQAGPSHRACLDEPASDRAIRGRSDALLR